MVEKAEEILKTQELKKRKMGKIRREFALYIGNLFKY